MDSCLFLGIFLSLFFIRSSFCRDDFGTWQLTLKSFQSHACDDEELLLQCTKNTIISVHHVLYGRTPQSAHLCPGKRSGYYTTTVCQHPKALQVIHEKCHKSMMCRLQISPELFKGDPCPGRRKFVEVFYKCRPELFLNKIACEGNQMSLRCPPGLGLTILSATFGTTKSGVDECPETNGPEDCLVDNTDQTVRDLCSGKQNCSIHASDNTFGNPSCIGRKYLKVAYNCVERELLLPPKQTSETSDEYFIEATSHPAWAHGIDRSGRTNLRSPVVTERPSDLIRQEMQSDEIPTDEEQQKKQKLVGFMSKWMSANKYIAGNKEKLILYLTISLVVGFLVFSTFLGGRYVVRRLSASRRTSRSGIAMSPDAEEQFFSDSDDAEEMIATTAFDPEILPPPTIHYSASMKRHDSVATPRTPIQDDVEMNHYFS